MHGNTKLKFNESEFKQEALPVELQACHLDHHLQCPNSTGGDAQVLKLTCRNQAPKSHNAKISSPCETQDTSCTSESSKHTSH